MQPDAQLVIAGGASLLDHGAASAGFPAAHRRGRRCWRARWSVSARCRTREMPSLYRLADALVFPSVKEGFGLVVLEAMASGIPVVTSRIAPFTEYLARGRRGLVRSAQRRLDRRGHGDGAQRAAAHAAAPRAASCWRAIDWRNAAQAHLPVYHRIDGAAACLRCASSSAGPTARPRVLFAVAGHQGSSRGASAYPLADFLPAAAIALTIASDRVRAKFGFACSQRDGAACPDREPRRRASSDRRRRRHRHRIRRIAFNDEQRAIMTLASVLAFPRRHRRRRPGRPLGQLLSAAARHRARGVREAHADACLEGRSAGTISAW